ncbi:YcjX family protein [Vibrio sp. SM6]|uniref:YcjX family protein n=1 Tax=Vibrio agarilyticus TaxID=2726741 RepID=A0A7X8TQ92_9VIBR|nr:YcjX family protein [Vibrio agarilyticus]NLS12632.1 YcjX family protein [Vibrio agarilyticus]
MKNIAQDVQDFLHRSRDSHVRIAVTGLSRAGKTAFITSLVNQLLYSATHDNLPLLSVARERRMIGAKREPQTNLMVPRFGYDEAMSQLLSTPPQWPEPTRDVSEIRLALKYKPQKTSKKLLGKTATLHLDLIDYPGEWLLDLPLLEMDFATWSSAQWTLLTGKRAELSQPFQDAVAKLDLDAEVDEAALERIAQCFTDYLLACKTAGLHWVQPGRFVLPGELAGAPVLQFFPVTFDSERKVIKNSNLAVLIARYKQYQDKVVKAFYKHHFATFDRQIVLVDCLQPLNIGADAFFDMRSAIEQLMRSFRYGRSGLLSRLFAPKIDKVLFAATKADHVTPDQHGNLVSLLQQMVHPAWQTAAFDNIEMNCMSMASVTATQSGFIATKAGQQAAIQGTTLTGEPLTLFPGEVPKRLPEPSYWQQHGFEFVSFQPLAVEDTTPLNHIRVDKALEYLIGDKLA